MKTWKRCLKCLTIHPDTAKVCDYVPMREVAFSEPSAAGFTVKGTRLESIPALDNICNGRLVTVKCLVCLDFKKVSILGEAVSCPRGCDRV